MNEWREFMNKHMAGADQSDGGYIAAYGLCKTMLQVLQQANGDFSRENIMKQVTSLHDVENPCAAARHQDQHQPDQLSSDHRDAAGEVERQILGAVWRGYPGFAVIARMGVTASCRHARRL